MFAAALTAAVGTGIYEARRASALRNEVETLRLQQAPLADQIQQLTHERDDATTRVAALRNDNERLKRDTAEILRLRGDAARLRQSEQELAQMKAADAQKKSDPTETETKSLLARVKQLKQQLDQMPEKKIPELQFVTDRDWLIAVTKNPAETDTDARKALVTLRNRGKMAFAPMLRGALQEYINANNGLLPADIAQLRPYFQSPVDDAILQRYQLLHTGRLADVPQEEWLVAEKAPVDIDYDTRLRINNTSIGMVGIDAYPKQP
jgi:myosin heavy subunit